MATAIYMPKAGMAMEEGVLVRWLYQVGDRVEMNEPIMEIETDKITMESEAPATGILLATLVEEGDTVPVLQTIGWIGEAGEKIPEIQSGKKLVTASAEKDDTIVNATVAVNTSGKDIAATPYAKTLAKQQGAPLSSFVPTGRHGEIVAQDVQKQPAGMQPAGITPPLPAIVPESRETLLQPIAHDSTAKSMEAYAASAVQDDGIGGAQRMKLSGMRKVIAERMTKSYQEIPAVTQDTIIDMTELMLLREKINSSRSQQTKLSVNDFILRAVAIACREFPEFRTSLEGDELVTYPYINLGMAASTDSGLLVPVIRNADTLSLSALSAVSKELAHRARANKLLPDECTGSTLTISNLGMYGVDSFTPIINQPNPAIVGVCAIRDELALEQEGAPYIKKVMRICITLDHRIMDGALAARFALRVRDLLQQPLDMLL